MANKIEWLQLPGYIAETWNPVTGCTKISEGCANCWAEKMSKRMAGRYGYPISEPFAVTRHRDKYREPFSWRNPRMVFVCSMGDLFHEDVPFDLIHELFDIMEDEENQKHLFLILTKRARRMQMFFRDRYERNKGKIFENIWAGVSVENQEQANNRLFYLMMTNAHKLFVSAEPLLGTIELNDINWDNYLYIDTLAGLFGKQKDKQDNKLDWVIVGGESGHNARPMHPDWVRSIRDQCKKTETPFFFKQWGAWRPSGDNDKSNINNFTWISTYGKTEHPLKEYFTDINAHHELMFKTGKKHAGRKLDGREHNEYPTVETRHCLVSVSEEKKEDIT